MESHRVFEFDLIWNKNSGNKPDHCFRCSSQEQSNANKFRTKYVYCNFTCSCLLLKDSRLRFRCKEQRNCDSVCVFLLVLFFCAAFWVRFFSPPTAQLPVFVIGLSHSHWPRCQLSVHPCQTFSRTSGARKENEGGWCVGLHGGRAPRAFQGRNFTWCEKTSLFLSKNIIGYVTNAKWHRCHTKAYFKCCCFVLKTMIHTESSQHCSTVPRACSLEFLTF